VLEHVTRRHAHATAAVHLARRLAAAHARSSLPLALSGSAGSQTICAGNMYSGSLERSSP
jgi:hypothetical protein